MHLCAPTFGFLAGASGALSAERRIAQGRAASTVDRHLVASGALIALLVAVACDHDARLGVRSGAGVRHLAFLFSRERDGRSVPGAIVVLLYPACLRYDAYKKAHPHGFTRYI